MAGILESLADGLTITQYSDWLTFVDRLNSVVLAGQVRRVPVLKRVWSDDEEWFLDLASREIYVYAPPNPPSMTTWEKVDVLRYLEVSDPTPLSVFQVGQISVMTAHIMKMRLEDLVGRGLAEELSLPVEVPRATNRTEKWYRDNVSNVVYRLTEYYGLQEPDDIRWEPVPQSELSARIQ
jgi:hypothetical protein